MTYTLCDSEASLQTAVDYLSGHQLVLDCEGKDLGRRGGALGLISLARSDNDDSIFLLDPLSLDATVPAMIKLLSILSNPNTSKIVWDGRMDAIALLEKYGVDLAGVLDLQLAEIMSRNLRGENDENRKSRLYSAVGPSVKNSPHLYEHVYPLCGLDRCLKDMGVGSEYAKSDFVKRMHQESGSALWMTRPIHPELLAYAANDVRAIRALLHHFVRNNWIADDMSLLLKASSRYTTLYSAPLDPADIFAKGGPFLPLDVITVLGGPQRQCADCKRKISEQHFAVVARRNGTLARSCRVCEALKVNAMRYPKRA